MQGGYWDRTIPNSSSPGGCVQCSTAGVGRCDDRRPFRHGMALQVRREICVMSVMRSRVGETTLSEAGAGPSSPMLSFDLCIFSKPSLLVWLLLLMISAGPS